MNVRWTDAWLLAALAAAICPTALPARQVDRRQPLRTPGLVLETGAPAAATRALTFTEDGKYLLAAGEDKVVRVWPFAGGALDGASMRTLRWQTWHEWLGAVYAMALSPPPEQRLVAVAGCGGYPGAVAVIDRVTGKVVAGLRPPDELPELDTVTRSIAFAPSGDEVAFGKSNGSVWAWNFRRKGTKGLRRLGGHGPREGASFNRVGLVMYQEDDKLISVAEDRRVLRWSVKRPGAPPEELFRIGVPNAARFAVSADRRCLAVAGQEDEAAKANRVEVWSLDGRVRRINLPERALASALAFGGSGQRLAVGVERGPEVGKDHRPKHCSVRVFNADRVELRPLDEFDASYFVDAVAFSPDGKHLAVAGGNDHELVILDLAKRVKAAVVRSPGAALWGVGLSRDGVQLGFRRLRNPTPSGRNDWGTGPWTAFDLKKRGWSGGGAAFRPVEPVTEMGGWRVNASHYRDWYVSREGAKPQRLRLDPAVDGYPTCYTFLRPQGGGVHLAVGHKWGVTIFSLGDRPRRIRAGYGHAGEVTAVAPSADHKLLVTASRDQTVCCWSLAPWDHQRELGAKFAREGDRLLVTAVADGSPAWEAGLSRGDEILALEVGGRPVPRSQWINHLEGPEPNRELYFEVRRREVGDRLPPMSTTVKQRPLWRFFPTDGGEWVLWRWQDYFYDCSAAGDSLVGWQVNGDIGDTPEFFPAEKFRKDRHRPDKVLQAVSTSLYAPARVSIPDSLPPKVTLELLTGRSKARFTVEIKLSARSAELPTHARSGSLWINDHKYRTWTGAVPFERIVEVPESLLRTGQNILVAQAYNEHAHDDSTQIRIEPLTLKRDPSKLHGLFVGVRDYSNAPRTPKEEVWRNLWYPVKDAEAMYQVWERQTRTGLYIKGRFTLLCNDKATRDSVLAELARLKEEASANDLVVIFLAGHGWSGSIGPNRFAFACPRFDTTRFEETGLSSDTLYDAIVSLSARKLVLIDACNSGIFQHGKNLGSEYVRALTPNGMGPTIISACRLDQKAFEDPGLGHGLFTQAIISALTNDFPGADRNRNGEVDALELGTYVQSKVPKLLDLLRPSFSEKARGVQQNPQMFPALSRSLPELFRPLARKCEIP
jgi:WD40 repeat protein